MLVKEFIEELQKLPQDVPVMYDNQATHGLDIADIAAVYYGEIQLPPELQKELGEESYKCAVVCGDGEAADERDK